MNADETPVGMSPRYALLRHLNWPASIAFFAVFPALLLAALFVTALQIEAVAGDFSAFYGAAESVLRGESPYVSAHDPAAGVFGSYVFPPLVALGVIPFTVLPQDVAGLLAMALLVCALLAIPFTLGVRDWRCFGLAIMWPRP